MNDDEQKNVSSTDGENRTIAEKSLEDKEIDVLVDCILKLEGRDMLRFINMMIDTLPLPRRFGKTRSISVLPELTDSFEHAERELRNKEPQILSSNAQVGRFFILPEPEDIYPKFMEDNEYKRIERN